MTCTGKIYMEILVADDCRDYETPAVLLLLKILVSLDRILA